MAGRGETGSSPPERRSLAVRGPAQYRAPLGCAPVSRQSLVVPATSVDVRPELLALSHTLGSLPLMLVTAPAGSGKTTLLGAWRAALVGHGALTAWLALGPLHGDLALFVEDLLAEIARALGAPAGEDPFAAALLRDLPHLAAPDPERLAALVARELRELAEPLYVFLDGYERLPSSGDVDRLVSALARDASLALQLVVASRGTRPAAAARLLAEGRARELGPDDLSLRADQIDRVLTARGVALDPDLVLRLLAETRGWVSGVLVAANTLRGRSRDEAQLKITALAREPDLFGYLAGELLAGTPPALVALLERAAFLGPVPRTVLERAAGDGAARLVDTALERGLLLLERDGLGLHPLWAKLLRDRLTARLPHHEVERFGARVVDDLERAGLAERGVEVSRELGLHAQTAALLTRHGLGWLERGGYERVSHWLAAAGADAASRDPKLALLAALILARRDLEVGLDALEAVAARFRAAGDDDAEIDVLHNAVILAGNANRIDRLQRLVRRIVRVRHLMRSARARSAAAGFAGMGAFVAGRYRLAERILARVQRLDLGPRERGGLAIGRVRIATLAGDWERAAAQVAEACADPELRAHAPAFHTLEGFRAQLDGLLGRDLPDALLRLEQARAVCASFRLGVTEVLLGLALAPLLAGARRADEALEVLERCGRRAEELAHEEGSVATHALRATIQLGAGRRDAARSAASAALERAGATVLRRSPWYPALACHALAEAGDAERADAFARARRRALDCADLPLMQHAIHLSLARVAALAGDHRRAQRGIERAWRAAAEADLRHVSREIGVELLAWGEAQAASLPWARVAAARLHPNCAGAAIPPLRIATLGGVEVFHHGVPAGAAAWRGTTVRRLLVRLLVARGLPLPRERIEADLWPELPAASAKNNLRFALSRLRRVLDPERRPGDPDRWVRIDGDRVSLTEMCREAWDVVRFEGLLATDGGEDPDMRRRRAALELYAGPFAPEVDDAWASELRTALERTFAIAGETLGRAHLAAGDPASAREVAMRLLAELPGDEASWCLLVDAELAGGDRSAALRAAQRAAEALERELGIAPGPALRALVARASR